MTALRDWFMPALWLAGTATIVAYALWGHEYGWRIVASIGAFFLIGGAGAAFLGEQAE